MYKIDTVFMKICLMCELRILLGKGSQCGGRVCNKYADCHFDFGSNEFQCRCVLGFQGDGYSCERAPSM